MRKSDRKRPYPPDFVSAETLAYRLDCSERQVTVYAKAKILPPPVTVGNLVRWSWAEVLDHIKLQNDGTLATGDDAGNVEPDDYSQDIIGNRQKAKAKETTREKANDRVA